MESGLPYPSDASGRGRPRKRVEVTYEELLALVEFTVGACRDCGHVVEVEYTEDVIIVTIRLKRET